MFRCFFPADTANANSSHTTVHEKSGIHAVVPIYYIKCHCFNSFKDLMLKGQLVEEKIKKTDKNEGKRKDAGKRDLHMKL